MQSKDHRPNRAVFKAWLLHQLVLELWSSSLTSLNFSFQVKKTTAAKFTECLTCVSTLMFRLNSHNSPIWCVELWSSFNRRGTWLKDMVSIVQDHRAWICPWRAWLWSSHFKHCTKASGSWGWGGREMSLNGPTWGLPLVCAGTCAPSLSFFLFSSSWLLVFCHPGGT